MTDRELLNAIKNDDARQEKLAELQQKLSAELDKPDEDLDVDVINELTLAIEELTGNRQTTELMAEKGIRRLEHDLRKMKIQRIIRRSKWIAACIGVVLVLSNIFSYSAYGINVFSAAYRLMNGSITIDLNQEDSEPYSGNPYVEEMRDICEKHNINVNLPTYIPYEVTPTDLFGDFHEVVNCNILFFNFERGRVKLNIEIVEFVSDDTTSPISIPSDNYNMSQQQIGDTIVHIQKEGQQYWAVFQIDLTQYLLYADGLDFDECQRILESMF